MEVLARGQHMAGQRARRRRQSLYRRLRRMPERERERHHELMATEPRRGNGCSALRSCGARAAGRDTAAIWGPDGCERVLRLSSDRKPHHTHPLSLSRRPPFMGHPHAANLPPN